MTQSFARTPAAGVQQLAPEFTQRATQRTAWTPTERTKAGSRHLLPPAPQVTGDASVNSKPKKKMFRWMSVTDADPFTDLHPESV